MKSVKGFWLPDNEQHLVPFLDSGPEFAGGPTYQFHKFAAAFPFIKTFGHAVDIGAHCGLWSRVLAQCFTRVSAFEPVSTHSDCWYANVPSDRTCQLYEFALGEKEGSVTLHTGESSTGDTYVQSGGEHDATMRTLDSFNFVDVDFVKIDCEGYEFFILQGAGQLVRKCRPIIIVEQKPGKGRMFGLGDHAAVDLLKTWGYEVVKEIAGDFIMRPRP